MAPAAITFDRANGSLRAEVADVLSMQTDEIKGMDGQGPPVISNALLCPVPQPLRQGKAGDISYRGHWDAEFSGTNSFVSDFRYED